MNKIIFIAALLCSITANAQNVQYDSNYSNRYFLYGRIYDGADTLNYRILRPDDYDASKKYPFVIFLHGAGERGSDNEAQLTYVAEMFVQKNKEYPAFIIIPQCAPDDYWAVADIQETANGRTFSFPQKEEMNTSLGLVNMLIDRMLKNYPIDSARTYIMGMSMGAMGTFELVSRRPDTFAAAIAICGGGNEEAAAKYATKTPFWIFHGEADDVVPASLSVAMEKALKKAGGSPKLTLYPGVKHNSWDNAFAEPDLLKWLYSQRK